MANEDYDSSIIINSTPGGYRTDMGLDAHDEMGVVGISNLDDHELGLVSSGLLPLTINQSDQNFVYVPKAYRFESGQDVIVTQPVDYGQNDSEYPDLDQIFLDSRAKCVPHIDSVYFDILNKFLVDRILGMLEGCNTELSKTQLTSVTTATRKLFLSVLFAGCDADNAATRDTDTFMGYGFELSVYNYLEKQNKSKIKKKKILKEVSIDSWMYSRTVQDIRKQFPRFCFEITCRNGKNFLTNLLGGKNSLLFGRSENKPPNLHKKGLSRRYFIQQKVTMALFKEIALASLDTSRQCSTQIMVNAISGEVVSTKDKSNLGLNTFSILKAKLTMLESQKVDMSEVKIQHDILLTGLSFGYHYTTPIVFQNDVEPLIQELQRVSCGNIEFIYSKLLTRVTEWDKIYLEGITKSKVLTPKFNSAFKTLMVIRSWLSEIKCSVDRCKDVLTFFNHGYGGNIKIGARLIPSIVTRSPAIAKQNLLHKSSGLTKTPLYNYDISKCHLACLMLVYETMPDEFKYSHDEVEDLGMDLRGIDNVIMSDHGYSSYLGGICDTYDIPLDVIKPLIYSKINFSKFPQLIPNFKGFYKPHAIYLVSKKDKGTSAYTIIKDVISRRMRLPKYEEVTLNDGSIVLITSVSASKHYLTIVKSLIEKFGVNDIKKHYAELDHTLDGILSTKLPILPIRDKVYDYIRQEGLYCQKQISPFSRALNTNTLSNLSEYHYTNLMGVVRPINLMFATPNVTAMHNGEEYTGARIQKGKLLTHVLQGIECYFIYALATILQRYQAGCVVSNEHDGLISSCQITPDMVLQANEDLIAKCFEFTGNMGSHRFKLVDKQFVDTSKINK